MWKVKKKVKYMWIALAAVLITLISLKWIWIYWWILALWTWYITLRDLSFRELYKDQKFSVNRWPITKNILICTIIWILIRHIKDNIFIFDDSERYKNLLKLCILAIIQWLIFILINIKWLRKLKKIYKNTLTKKI